MRQSCKQCDKRTRYSVRRHDGFTITGNAATPQPFKNNKKYCGVAALVWRICLPMPNEEHLFTGLSKMIDAGDWKKRCHENGTMK